MTLLKANNFFLRNLVAKTAPIALAITLLVSGASVEAKRLPFQLAPNGKMDDGESTAVADTSPVADASTTTKSKSAKNSGLLAPVTLASTFGGQSNVVSDADTTLLKSTVSETDFLPKGPIDGVTDETFSIKQNKNLEKGNIASKLFKQAKQVNAMPLALVADQDEADKKASTTDSAEKQQLAYLWECTLERSPDIQFVMTRLMPTDDPSHAGSVAMKMLSTALYGAMGTLNMVAPSPGVSIPGQMGGSALMNLMGMQESKRLKNARIQQTEAVMMYKMVREVADRLVEDYRKYKAKIETLNKAQQDLQDLQSMVTDARVNAEPAKQIDMEYTVRKAQREVEAIAKETESYRKKLIDLAGGQAVDKLDTMLVEEQQNIQLVTPVGVTK
jgi:hypothetical protein